MRLWPVVLVGLVALAFGVGGCAGAPPSSPASPAAKGPVGDFRSISIRDLSGRATPLAAVLEHRPTLVSFWAPWCEPCLREQPDLERLGQAARACGGAVVGVAVGEAPEGIAAFVRQKGLSFPELTDEHFELADAVGQRRIPATLVFDDAQRVVFTGEALGPKAVTALKSALAARPGAPSCAMP